MKSAAYVCVLALWVLPSSSVAEPAAEVISLQVNIGGTEEFLVDSEALYVDADSDIAVVLVHQSGASMYSWMPLTEALSDAAIASISLRDARPGDVAAGLAFLVRQGYTELDVIGASVGGSAMLSALADPNTHVPAKVVYLGSAAGPAFDSARTEKLHIISKRDFFASQAYSVFEASGEPKSLLELDTHLHAQDLLDSEFADEVIRAILSFLTNDAGKRGSTGP